MSLQSSGAARQGDRQAVELNSSKLGAALLNAIITNFATMAPDICATRPVLRYKQICWQSAGLFFRVCT